MLSLRNTGRAANEKARSLLPMVLHTSE